MREARQQKFEQHITAVPKQRLEIITLQRGAGNQRSLLFYRASVGRGMHGDLATHSIDNLSDLSSHPASRRPLQWTHILGPSRAVKR